MAVVVFSSTSFSGVLGLWLDSSSDPSDPVFLKTKNQTARAIDPTKHRVMMTIQIMIAAAASSNGTSYTSNFAHSSLASLYYSDSFSNNSSNP
jgi:hypothetical protein